MKAQTAKLMIDGIEVKEGDDVLTLTGIHTVTKQDMKQKAQTAKEYVLERYPKMRQERHKERTGRTTRAYTLLRNNNEYMWFACGETPKQAWQNAKAKIEEMERVQ